MRVMRVKLVDQKEIYKCLRSAFFLTMVVVTFLLSNNGLLVVSADHYGPNSVGARMSHYTIGYLTGRVWLTVGFDVYVSNGEINSFTWNLGPYGGQGYFYLFIISSVSLGAVTMTGSVSQSQASIASSVPFEIDVSVFLPLLPPLQETVKGTLYDNIYYNTIDPTHATVYYGTNTNEDSYSSNTAFQLPVTITLDFSG
ncbi:hypothetical protein SacRon12I_09925 [Sulfolobus acidocaldarius Ron12/I]|uniref:Uncharacterized protein n=2 Tax=Sulfolobus acidocaldarius TaxID=2285 RepID=M1J0R5_9CREN|nr:hypothetical protein SacRon12I_09925 [Sulfolobus acidocaldarius Ron12/I]